MSRLDALIELTRSRPGDPFAWYGLAMEYDSAVGDVEKAEATFRKMLAEFPDYVPAHQMLGQLLARQGRGHEAREALRVGVEAARGKGNAKALSEMQSLLDSLG